MTFSMRRVYSECLVNYDIFKCQGFLLISVLSVLSRLVSKEAFNDISASRNGSSNVKHNGFVSLVVIKLSRDDSSYFRLQEYRFCLLYKYKRYILNENQNELYMIIQPITHICTFLSRRECGIVMNEISWITWVLGQGHWHIIHCFNIVSTDVTNIGHGHETQITHHEFIQSVKKPS